MADTTQDRDRAAERLLSLDAVAERLNVPRRSAYGWVQTRRLKSYKLGRNIRIAQADLDAFLKAHAR